MDEHEFEAALTRRQAEIAREKAEEQRAAAEAEHAREQSRAEAMSLTRELSSAGPLFVRQARAMGIPATPRPTGAERLKYRFFGRTVQVQRPCWTIIPPVFSGRDRGAGERVGLWIDEEGVFWWGMVPAARLEEIGIWPPSWPAIDADFLADILARAAARVES